MKSQDIKKSSLELKQEVRGELNKVKQGLDEIQGRMTPGQLIDDAIFYPNGGSPRRTLEHLKNNPIGTGLLSMGTFLLMEDKNRGSIERRIKDKASSGVEALRESRNDPRINEAKEKFNDMKSNLKDKVSAFRTDLASKIPDKTKFEDFDNSNLLFLGVGLGAMTGASIPVSERENTLFQDAGLGGRLSEFDREFRDALNESSNILKDLVLKDVNGFDLNIF